MGGAFLLLLVRLGGSSGIAPTPELQCWRVEVELLPVARASTAELVPVPRATAECC